MRQEDLIKLAQTIELLQAVTLTEIGNICAQDVDVHSVAPSLGALGRYCITNYEAMFEKHIDEQCPPLVGTAQELKEEIVRECAVKLPEYSSNIENILTSWLSMSDPEPETSISAQYLLRRAWGFRTSVVNGAEMIIENLNYNIVTNGGCNAGIAARLVHTYAILLLETMCRVQDKHVNNWSLAAYTGAMNENNKRQDDKEDDNKNSDVAQVTSSLSRITF